MDQTLFYPFIYQEKNGDGYDEDLEMEILPEIKIHAN